MDKRLVNTLLRIFHSTEMEFPLSASLSAFQERFNVGRVKGKKLVLVGRDKLDIQVLLQSEAGVEAESTYPEDWQNKGRAESLSLGRNEKFARHVVSEGRLQIKALQGHALSVAGCELDLPDGFDAGCLLSTVLGHPIHHGAILVVENKQSFDELWHISHGLLDHVAGLNPLVVYRGDATGGARVDATHALIDAANLPVWAFVDYDPAGMVIAASLPKLDHLVMPGESALKALLDSHGLKSRYDDQIAGVRNALTALSSNTVLSQAIRAIEETGRGLPQEHFHQRLF